MNKYVVHEKVLDERGRCITPKELRWMQSKLSDPYDPRFLCFCINITTGLRNGKSIMLRLPDFTEGLEWLKTWQNKPKRTKNGFRLVSKPKNVPIPDWLRTRLLNYIKYRLVMGHYVGQDLTSMRLFPTLKDFSVRDMIDKMRRRYVDEAPWLGDIWKVVDFYDPLTQEKVKSINLYRINPHAGRAFYTTAAYEVVDHDAVRGAALSGHERLKDFMKYAKAKELVKAKIEIKERIMDPLMSDNGLPVLKGQKRMDDYYE